MNPHDAVQHVAELGLEGTIRNLSFEIVAIATLVLVGLIIISAFSHKRSSIIFGLIVTVVLATSGFLIGSTVYLNTVSSSGGPVHWHADFEVWNCGTQVELKDPVGALSNKIGTPTLHEHNDKRIHLEGVVVEHKDASLGKFFNVVGGSLSADSLTIPTNEVPVILTNGQLCNGQSGQLQVFAYQTSDDGFYTLRKLDDPTNFVIAPQSQVPPGDCIIIELDLPKLTTDKMCRSYQVALQIGKLKGAK